MKSIVVTAAIVLTVGAASHAAGMGPVRESKMLDLASRFIGTLDAAQKTKALMPFDSEERFNWFYTPVPRNGLTFKEMTEPQRKMALELLRSGLSAKGYHKAETIRQLENVLKEIEVSAHGSDTKKEKFKASNGTRRKSR